MSIQDFNSPVHYEGPPPRQAPRWLRPLLLLLAALGLLALLIRFIPGLYHRTVSTGRLLKSHPDMFRLNSSGKLELAVQSPAVVRGEALAWTELWHDFSYYPVQAAQDETLASALRRDFDIADFDGDGSDEIYVSIAAENATLLELDGSSRQLGQERNALTFSPTLWDGNADGAVDFLLGSIFRGDDEEDFEESERRGLPVYNVDNRIIARIRDPEMSMLADLYVGDFLDRGDRQLAYEIDTPQAAATQQQPADDSFHFDLSRDIDAAKTQQLRLKVAKMKPLDGFRVSGEPELKLVADVDGDGRDELVFIGNGRYRCFGWKQPEQAGELPGYIYPSMAADMDGDGVDELVYCHGDSMLLGYRFINVMLKAFAQTSLDEIDIEEADSETEISREQARQLLEFVRGVLEKQPELQPYQDFIEEMIARDMTDADGLENDVQLLEMLLNRFGDMLTPHGGILELQSGELIELQFPADRHPSHFFLGMPGPLTVCQLPGQSRVIWLATAMGGGLFGFDAAGNCVYQENFGEPIKGLYTVNTPAGQGLVVEFADRLLICSISPGPAAMQD